MHMANSDVDRELNRTGLRLHRGLTGKTTDKTTVSSSGESEGKKHSFKGMPGRDTSFWGWRRVFSDSFLEQWDLAEQREASIHIKER